MVNQRRRMRSVECGARNLRTGVTLAEVLVSLGIMSLGVVLLATLFPLSVLRTIQATQLTHATITRYNVEATIDAFPQLLNASGGESRFVVDPAGFYRAVADSDDNPSGPGPEDAFGAIKRYSNFTPGGAGEARFLSAVRFATSPDSWVKIVDDEIASIGANTAVLGEEIDAVNIGDRIVFFSSDGRASETRLITNVAAGTRTVTWDATQPANITGQLVTRIETLETYYNWLLSVRNSNVDVVVFFNRAFGPDDEVPYTATFTDGSPNASIDLAGRDPDLKAGGFVLDSTNLVWYRIARIDRTVGTEVFITLDRGAKANATQAMILPQVVDVYPIGIKTP